MTINDTINDIMRMGLHGATVVLVEIPVQVGNETYHSLRPLVGKYIRVENGTRRLVLKAGELES